MTHLDADRLEGGGELRQTPAANETLLHAADRSSVEAWVADGCGRVRVHRREVVGVAEHLRQDLIFN